MELWEHMLILLKCCGTCSTCVSNIQYCVVEFTAVQQTCWNSWANLVGGKVTATSLTWQFAVSCQKLSWSVAASVMSSYSSPAAACMASCTGYGGLHPVPSGKRAGETERCPDSIVWDGMAAASSSTTLLAPCNVLSKLSL